jgi:hypothetical protein
MDRGKSRRIDSYAFRAFFRLRIAVLGSFEVRPTSRNVNATSISTIMNSAPERLERALAFCVSFSSMDAASVACFSSTHF